MPEISGLDQWTKAKTAHTIDTRYVVTDNRLIQTNRNTNRIIYDQPIYHVLNTIQAIETSVHQNLLWTEAYINDQNDQLHFILIPTTTFLGTFLYHFDPNKPDVYAKIVASLKGPEIIPKANEILRRFLDKKPINVKMNTDQQRQFRQDVIRAAKHFREANF